jgi:hypothetical protein
LKTPPNRRLNFFETNLYLVDTVWKGFIGYMFIHNNHLTALDAFEFFGEKEILSVVIIDLLALNNKKAQHFSSA